MRWHRGGSRALVVAIIAIVCSAHVGTFDVFFAGTILKSTGQQDSSQFPATCEGLS